MNLISLFITSILSENILLSKLLGLPSSFVYLKNRNETLKVGLFSTVIITLTSILSYLLYNNILLPNNIEYLRIILFAIVIIFVTIICMMIIKLISMPLHQMLNTYIPLIIVNSCVLGVILLSIQNDYKFLEVLIYSFGSGIGYMLITYIISTINDSLEHAPIIRGFKGLPIMFITLFIISLLFTRYIAG